MKTDKSAISLLLLILLLISASSGCIDSGSGIKDTDGDGVTDEFDKCPNEKGAISNSGCPEETSSEVTSLPPTTTSMPTSTPVGIKAPESLGWVEWEYYDDAIYSMRSDGKPVLLYFWYDDCPFSHSMNDTTLSDPEVVTYIEENFHPVEVDRFSSRSMSTTDPTITGTYLSDKYKANGIPAYSFIDSDEEVRYPYMGYADSEEMMIFLKYIAESIYENMNFSEYTESLIIEDDDDQPTEEDEEPSVENHVKELMLPSSSLPECFESISQIYSKERIVASYRCHDYKKGTDYSFEQRVYFLDDPDQEMQLLQEYIDTQEEIDKVVNDYAESYWERCGLMDTGEIGLITYGYEYIKIDYETTSKYEHYHISFVLGNYKVELSLTIESPQTVKPSIGKSYLIGLAREVEDMIEDLEGN